MTSLDSYRITRSREDIDRAITSLQALDDLGSPALNRQALRVIDGLLAQRNAIDDLLTTEACLLCGDVRGAHLVGTSHPFRPPTA